jgi:hypothetical protein
VAELMDPLLLLSRSPCRQLQWLILRRSSTHAAQLFKPAASSGKLWFESAVNKKGPCDFRTGLFLFLWSFVTPH